jgi:hypothetical protein
MTIESDWLLIIIILVVTFVMVMLIEFDNKKYNNGK